MAPFVPPPPFLALDAAKELEALALKPAAEGGLANSATKFTGAAFVEWAAKTKFAAATDANKDARENAAKCGQSLLDHRLAHHVTDDAEFEPAPAQSYAFISRERPEVQAAHKALGDVLLRTDMHQSTLQIKHASWFGLVNSWVTTYAVLDPATSDPNAPRMLRLYKRRSAASPPFAEFAVQGCPCTVKECVDCKQDWTCFTLEARKGTTETIKTITLCADHSKRQEGWISALVEAGVEWEREEQGEVEKVESLYELKARRLNSEEVVDLSQYRGKVSLVVNVSSNCGLTPKNYPQLVELQHKYHDQGLEVLLFPSNDFANQEPGDEPAIEKFAHDKYGVDFDMFEKVHVNGKGGTRPHSARERSAPAGGERNARD